MQPATIPSDSSKQQLISLFPIRDADRDICYFEVFDMVNGIDIDIDSS